MGLVWAGCFGCGAGSVEFVLGSVGLLLVVVGVVVGWAAAVE